jgi:hypothetical protein
LILMINKPSHDSIHDNILFNMDPSRYGEESPRGSAVHIFE